MSAMASPALMFSSVKEILSRFNEYKTEGSRVCRACLQHGAENDMFHGGGELARRYSDCTNLQARLGDGFSEYICGVCSKKINEFYQFRRTCLNSHAAILRELEEHCIQIDSQNENDLVMQSENPTCQDYCSPKSVKVEDNSVLIKEEVHSTHNLMEALPEKSKLDINDDGFNPIEICSTEEVLHDESQLNIHKGSSNESTIHMKHVNALFHCDKCKKHFTKLSWLIKHQIARGHCTTPDARNSKPDNCIAKDVMDNVNSVKIRKEKSIDEIVAQDCIKMRLPIKESDPKVVLQCDLCERMYASKLSLKRHQESHIKPLKQIPCEKCGKNINFDNIRQHMMKSHKFKQCHCKVCNKIFTKPYLLKQHQQRNCNKKISRAVVLCHVCGMAVTDVHMKTHLMIHADEKKYSCKVCNKSFALPIYLKLHEKCHEAVGRFACDICSKKFTRKVDMTRHIVWHSDKRPFACKLCNKTYRSSAYLTVHRRTHTGERPYQCKICEQTFKTGTSLKYHGRTHNAERSYCCQHCDKRYKGRCSLNRHVKAHHSC